MSEFIHTGEKRNTSPELMAAIFKVADQNETIAEFIWETGPTKDQLREIIQIVTENGRFKTTDFCWGVTGPAWADF